jgi:hypothetical protein
MEEDGAGPDVVPAAMVDSVAIDIDASHLAEN